MTATAERRPVHTAVPTRRGYAIALVAVIAAHFALWAMVVVRGWLYWDDFILQGQAARLGLSRDLLLNNHDGHVMPASYAVVWLLQEIGGLDYGVVVASMMVGEIVLVTSAVLGFNSLLGRTLPGVLAIAVFLLSPIMIPGLTWWSASLTLVPLMSCALLATAAHVAYLRHGSRAALITTFALVVVALGFFEKSVLIVLWLFLLSAVLDQSPHALRSLRRAAVHHWRLWAAWTALLTAYMVAFAQVAEGRTRLPTGPGQIVELVGRALFNTIGPGLVGGPGHWTPVDFSASYADPPGWIVALGAVCTIGIVTVGVRHPGPARKAWVAAAVYLAADLTAFAVGRLGPSGDPAVVQAGRYVATAMIPIGLAVGATAASERHRFSDARWRWAAAAAVSVASLLTVVSTLAYGAIWARNPAQVWVGNAREDLAAADPRSPLLDQDVPDFILLPVTHPYNQTSWFLAPLEDSPAFDTSTPALQVLDNGGRLVPAAVEGPSGVPPGGGCLRLQPGTTTTVPLSGELIPWLHTVAIGYEASDGGLVDVSIGDGEPVAATIERGPGSVYVRAEGGRSSVGITSVDAEACITSVQVGRVVPANLPYGGSVDITDQLEVLGR